MIEIRQLKKSFRSLEVLRDISFSVERGDVIAVIGSSGSGKSTLLRCLINLESIDGGTVLVDGDPLIQDGVYASPGEVRAITMRMGMVFQSFNLFPHLSVRKNLTMPLVSVQKADPEKADARALELLKKVGLADRADEMPNHLSGGQKQRVAIARALMLNPEIMLFDEPTSALDPQLTGEVLSVMRQLAGEHMTMIVVTHEMSFARDVASRVLYMDGGEIVEAGTPDEVLKHPKNPRTAGFLGSAFA
ncbi:MAG TPA: amino acid ABC transporter ATP-binding protein [Candidatus Fimivivens faecavium]|nr:amino acid ABC transporter ATP-binding protein [Candidatus Fimivivens faecavium]